MVHIRRQDAESARNNAERHTCTEPILNEHSTSERVDKKDPDLIVILDINMYDRMGISEIRLARVCRFRPSGVKVALKDEMDYEWWPIRCRR
jgi:hypothetical protein